MLQMVSVGRFCNSDWTLEVNPGREIYLHFTIDDTAWGGILPQLSRGDGGWHNVPASF